MMGQMVGGRAIVLDAAGQPVPLAGVSPETVPAEAAQAARAGLTFTGQAGDQIVTAVPIPNRGGAVILLAPAEPVQHSLGLARRLMLLAGIGTLLLGAAMALALARRTMQPVIAIQEATQAIARGDFTVRVAVRSGDEIGLLSQAVNAMAARLAEYDLQRREFLANVAHELRTPLSYIRGYMQAMAEGVITAPADRERYIQVVHEEAVRLGRLVDDLMDLAAMEEGHPRLERLPLDLTIPITQALDIIRPQAQARSIQLQSDIPPNLPHPPADGGRIQQVVFNLLDNALRHTDAGGRIQVTAARQEDRVVVRVSNTGPGVDPADLSHIFERFYKQRSGGRGLGLAIVRSIVQAHGGEVGAHSQPGAETVFWFTLPVGMAGGPGPPL